MKYSYRLKRSCGNIYSNGNVIFTPDGNIALAPVGNRINVFDLIHQTTECLPIETKKDIHLLTLSHNSKYLVVIDVDGFGLFFHFQKKILLHQFNFRQKVYAIQFSWNDSYFAVTHGRGCQIWKTPSAVREFIPLKLLKTITGHYDETVSLDWSSNSKHLIIGSKDLTSRVYFNVPTNYMTLSVLVGHRDEVVGVFFSADDKQAYTIAGDGGVFVWQYARITLPAKLKANDSRMNVKPLSSSLRKRKNKRKSEEDDEGGKEEEDEEGTEEEDDSDEFDENDKEDSNHEQKEDPASFIDPENEGDEGLEANTISKVKTSRKGSYQLLHRHLLRDNQQGDITSSSFHKKSNLLVLGFSAGIVAIYEMPDCTNIHRLSISNHPVSTISINLSGEWLGMGIGALGQLLIWEWKSESYILKQQGHSYGLNVLDFSAEGQFVATGGDDGKVKIWNTFTGFCAVTFKEHLGPVTGVKFIGQGQGKAILSSSLDGTVRAHDLLRYKNFRTLTSPQAVQFTSLTADQSGEIVCAGSQDPFEIYVWALQTGKLLEVLSGHEGPIACLAYSSSTSMLASGSWDGTLKLWDIYNNSCIETFEHGCDVLAVAFRSDGKEVACTATDGNIYFWDTDSGEQKKNIEGRRDLAGGRVTTDRKTKENLTKSKYFTSISYSADGTSVLVGGKSKYICIYCIQTGVLVKKFQLSHNRSLEGIADRLRSDHLIDGVSIDNLKVDLTSPNAQAKSLVPTTAGPGTAKHHKTNLSTNTKLQHAEIMTYALQFSVTGKEFAVVSSEGLQIYSLDHLLTFIPMELDVTITPENAQRFFLAGNYLSSLQMSIILQDEIALRKIVETIPRDNIEIHIKQFDPKYLKQFIPFLTDQLESSRKLECYLYWIFMILQIHTMTMQRMMMNELSMIECFRNLLRVLLLHEKDLLQLMNKNSYLLQFIISQLQCPDEADQRNSPLPELMNGAGLDDEWKNNEDEVAEVAEVALDEEAMDEDLGEVVDGNVEFSPMEEEDNGVPWQSAWDDDDDDDNVISLNAGHDNIVEIDLESTKISKKKAAKSEKKKKSKTK